LVYTKFKIVKVDFWRKKNKTRNSTFICDYHVYALLLVHSIGSFLASIAALCLPIFGTYLCHDIEINPGYDSADMEYHTSVRDFSDLTFINFLILYILDSKCTSKSANLPHPFVCRVFTILAKYAFVRIWIFHFAKKIPPWDGTNPRSITTNI